VAFYFFIIVVVAFGVACSELGAVYCYYFTSEQIPFFAQQVELFENVFDGFFVVSLATPLPPPR
jgi:hypothetical protein